MKRLVGIAKRHQSALLIVWVAAAWCLSAVVYHALMSEQVILLRVGMATFALLMLSVLVVL
jgi:hypothetical protein